jgi:hypothetical protein
MMQAVLEGKKAELCNVKYNWCKFKLKTFCPIKCSINSSDGEKSQIVKGRMKKGPLVEKIS